MCVWLLASPAAAADGAIVLAGALPLWVLFNKLLGLYDRDANLIHKSTLDELPRLGLSVLLGTGLVYGFGPSLTGVELSRPNAMLFVGLALVFLPTVRGLTRNVAIKLTSPGPVLFSQRRIGRGTQPFELYKFRTMANGAEN